MKKKLLIYVYVTKRKSWFKFLMYNLKNVLVLVKNSRREGRLKGKSSTGK